MSNRVTIEIDVDPNGRGAAAIRGINSSLDNLGNGGASNFNRAAASGRDLASSFDDIKGAIAGAAIVEFGRQSVTALAASSDAQRVLKASAKETGLAYDELNQKAGKFGDLIGQSETEAKKSFASIVQFAKQAGRSDEIDGFTTRLTDLLAARGVSADKIPDLLSQLKTGQDEVFDRLFGANPSKFYDEYAKSVGKTAESLTDLEKAQVRFDAIVKGGAIFSGEAAARANDLSGGLDQLNANIENLKKNLGQKISGPANSLIGLLNAGLSGKSNAQFEQLTNYLGLTDTTKSVQQIQQEGERAATQIVKDFRAQEANIRAAIENPNGSLENSALSKINLTRFTLELDPNKRADIIAKATAEATGLRDQLKRALEETAKDDKSSVSLLRLAIKELNTSGNLLGDDKNKIRKQLEDAIERQVKPALEKVKELKKKSTDLFSDLTVKANSDNPLVKIFADAKTLVEKVREETRGLNKDVQSAALNLADKANSKQLNQARFEQASSALSFRQQAARLEFGQIGLSADALRSLDTLSARIATMTNSFDKQAEFYRQLNQANPNDFNQKLTADFAETFAKLNETKNGFEKDRLSNVGQQQIGDIVREALNLRATGGANAAEKNQIADAVLNKINSLPQEVLRNPEKFFGDRFGNTGVSDVRQLRELAAQSLTDKQSFVNSQLQEAIARQQFGTFARNDALAQLNLIKNASGVDAEFKNKKFLSTLSGLDSSEFSPELRRGQIDALKTRADIEEKREQEAGKIRQADSANLKSLNTNIEKLLRIAESGGLTQIEVLLKEDGTAEQTPRQKAPNARDTADAYGALGDFAGGFGGF